MLIGTGQGLIGLESAALKLKRTYLTVTPAAHLKVKAQRIHSLKAHAVQTHALLESLAVKLTAGIQHAHSLHKLALRDSAPVVTHRYPARVRKLYLYALAGIHAELIHAVVNDLLEQHIDSVIGCRAVAQLAYVHTRTRTDMLHIVHVADIILIILHRLWCIGIE